MSAMNWFAREDITASDNYSEPRTKRTTSCKITLSIAWLIVADSSSPLSPKNRPNTPTLLSDATI